jgi:hypothetical protein
MCEHWFEPKCFHNSISLGSVIWKYLNFSPEKRQNNNGIGFLVLIFDKFSLLLSFLTTCISVSIQFHPSNFIAPHYVYLRSSSHSHCHPIRSWEKKLGRNFIKIYRVSMYVCILDWGQSVIRDEMRFYGWWKVSHTKSTHAYVHVRT